MTYVFGGTLNIAQLNSALSYAKESTSIA